MSQHVTPNLRQSLSEDHGSLQSNSRVDDTSRMINLSDLVLDIAPISMLPAPTQDEARTLSPKDVRASGKSSYSNTGKKRVNICLGKESEEISPIGPIVVDEDLSEDGNISLNKRRRRYVTK